MLPEVIGEIQLCRNCTSGLAYFPGAFIVIIYGSVVWPSIGSNSLEILDQSNADIPFGNGKEVF